MAGSVDEARAAEQHLRGLDRRAQPLRKVAPPPRSQPDHLDHASDCMPIAPPKAALLFPPPTCTASAARRAWSLSQGPRGSSGCDIIGGGDGRGIRCESGAVPPL